MISVLVPYREDGGRRDQLWRWVFERQRALLPDAEIVVGHSSPGPFNRSEAVNDAAKRARGDIFLIADADMAIDRRWLVLATPRAWANEICYHQQIHYLHEADSNLILKGPPDADLIVPADTEFSSKNSWGGVCMLGRQAFQAVRGMDVRFIGWGPDDVALMLALSTLWRPPLRLEGDLIHLWHPAPPTTRPWGEGQNAMMTEYDRAKDDPALMRQLIATKPWP